jgi:hypothetical protein
MSANGFRSLTVLVALAAAAAVAPPQAAVAGSAVKPHCVVQATRGTGGTPACYGTFTEAIAAATGGRINDAPATASAASRDNDLQRRLGRTTRTNKNAAGQRVVPGNVLLGVEFEDINFSGRSLTVWATSGCTLTTTDEEWRLDGLGDFNDEITSFIPYSGCWADHWEHTYVGMHTGYLPATAYLGDAMSDQTSSIKWS